MDDVGSLSIRSVQEKVLASSRDKGWSGLEAAISRPVPVVGGDGETRLRYLLYRSSAGPRKQMIYPPFMLITVDYPSGEVIGHEAIEANKAGEPLGAYPTEEMSMMSSEDWEAAWKELFVLYPDIIEAYRNGSIENQTNIDRFSKLFRSTTAPFFFSYYHDLNPDFFEWLGIDEAGL